MSRRKRKRARAADQTASARGQRLNRGDEAPGARSASKRLILLVLAAASALILILVFWMRSGQDGAKPSAPEVPSVARARIEFVDRQPTSGVDFILNNGTIGEKPIPDSTLGGVALLDYDNDGWLDIYFTNGSHLPSLKKTGASFHNRLYRNLGGEKFEDVTSTAGVAGSGYSMGAAAGDFDNDGRMDLYVTGLNRNILYRNEGGGRFEDMTGKAGVEGIISGKKLWSVAATWFDYDNDGHLDLFVVNYLDWSWAGNQLCGEPGKHLSCSPTMYSGLPNILYRNNGDSTFTDVSQAAGIRGHIGKGMSAAISDYDDDGFMDILVTNDSERNFLFRNLEGQRFEEVGVQSGVAFTEDGIPVSSMGVDFRDLNDDGREDITITALTNETFPLFLNQGGGLFADATYASKIGLATATMSGWGNGIFDLDNDGDKDLFTANSHVSENVGLYRQVKYRMANSVFENLGDGAFQDVSGEAGPAFAVEGAHRGCAFGDLNNDGRVDIVTSMIGGKPEVLFNTSAPDHHWLLLDLEGSPSNRSGIGARITLTSESGRRQYNHATTSVGYASSSDARVHFGLGRETRIREMRVRWPGGNMQVLSDVAVDQILQIREAAPGG